MELEDLKKTINSSSM